MRRPSLRLVLGLAAVLLGLLDIQALIQTIRAHTRVREAVTRSIHEAVVAARPHLVELFSGGKDTWDAAMRETAPLTSEVEVFDPSGRRLYAHPAPAPVRHWPTPDELHVIEQGGVLTLGPMAGEAWRLLSYVSFASGGEHFLLRLSTAVPRFEEDFRERRQLLMGHALALAVLLVAGALALFPGRPTTQVSAPAALVAYEEAMERLRDRGQALSREHEAERRRMEEEIQDKEALARAGELTAGIVHEVRNGLGTIVGYARLVERSASAPEALDAAHRIREECETLETVVRRFMDFVKRETLNLGTFDLGRMLSRVAARESRGGPGAAISVVGEAGPLVGDEELLERAFENLVRNAAQAAGRAGHVWVTATRETDRVAITVADDGPGITPEARQALRPFFTTKAGGLGLGLPITLKVVRLHQGDMVLADRQPRGLEVTVRLPASGPAA